MFNKPVEGPESGAGRTENDYPGWRRGIRRLRWPDRGEIYHPLFGGDGGLYVIELIKFTPEPCRAKGEEGWSYGGKVRVPGEGENRRGPLRGGKGGILDCSW